MMRLYDVFEETHKNGNFIHNFSNFAQIFLNDFDFNTVIHEPVQYAEIDKKHYVFAACFVHYWCDVGLLDIPEWVYGDMYKYESPVYEFKNMQEELNRITPYQFKEHNLFMRRSGVLCL